MSGNQRTFKEEGHRPADLDLQLRKLLAENVVQIPDEEAEEEQGRPFAESPTDVFPLLFRDCVLVDTEEVVDPTGT